MIDYKSAQLVLKGTKLVLDNPYGYYDITQGKVYASVHGYEEGIFLSRPFNTIIDDVGNEVCMHMSRFSFPKDKDNGG